MKKLNLILVLSFLIQMVWAQNSVGLKKWMVSSPQKIDMPAFSTVKNIDEKVFNTSDLFNNTQIDLDNGLLNWKNIEISDDNFVPGPVGANNLLILKSYLSVNRWTEGSLVLSSNALYQLFVDGELVKTNTDANLQNSRAELKLQTGNHQIALKMLGTTNDLKLAASFEFSNDFADCEATSGLNPGRYFSINDVLEGNTVSSAMISPSGKYVLINYSEVVHGSGKRKTYSDIYDLENHKNFCTLRNKNVENLDWLPRTDRLSYSVNFEGKSEIFIYDLASSQETSIAKNMQNLAGFSWSPTEDYIIYTDYIVAENPGDLKRVYGSEDRIPYFRNRSFLHKIDLKTGYTTLLTAGNLSANLQDVKADGSKILFSTDRMDYTEVPFTKQNLYEMDMRTMELTTVWENKLYDGYCTYSPDGKQLLVQGAPECFGELGVKVSKGRIPNSYDAQLYLYDLTTKKAEPITLNFDPAINSAYWVNDNEIYLSVTEKDYFNLYKYELKLKKFSKIPLSVEVLNDINFAYNKPVAVYSGTSISTPQKLYALDLKKETSTLLSFPKEKQFADIKFGKTETWNFINKNGTTIYGRVYYPPDYDQNKKYPVIVNYYGGTVPVERSFGGRYPLNNWAANGYIVYLLQPSGATGFGQDFSALHVNGWGLDAIDDIIDGTKEFLQSHPSADAKNVGCIGASYGGYTTMLLQTRTDIFKTAIAHAGISSITSYWGEGYWGYTYSTGAAKNSYPWNRKDIYVENSPIYNADKFKNSILLLHGTSDTNVPTGESLQYYAALKVLGKDVEMVLIDGQDHHILDYQKRIKWHYTIISWFDKKLKNQPQQWNEMYPEKNL